MIKIKYVEISFICFIPEVQVALSKEFFERMVKI